MHVILRIRIYANLHLLDLDLLLNIFSVNQNISGISLYWNDEELIIEPYDRIEKHYYCGKSLLQFKEGKTLMYSILVVDLSECYFADVFSDGEIKKLFSDDSTVPNKQGSGGQSQPRFQATRHNEIVAWFKKIDRMLMEYDRQVILSINWIHYNRFMEYMHTYNKMKIVQHIRGEYSGLCGIYDTINRLDNRKS